MDSTDGDVLQMNYEMGTELASYLMEDPIEMEELSSSLHDPSGIDLHLECEDDKSYDLPFNKSSLRLHSNNVSMRISFSSANDSLSCRYCKCNFLSESHLGKHMQQFHLESGDDYEDRWDGTDEELAPSSNQELCSVQRCTIPVMVHQPDGVNVRQKLQPMPSDFVTRTQQLDSPFSHECTFSLHHIHHHKCCQVSKCKLPLDVHLTSIFLSCPELADC